jgi:hypothetical protein
MMKIVAILPKNPYPKGRFGLLRYQDWYRQCKLAVDASLELDASIVTSSSFQREGCQSDNDCYSEAVRSLGGQITTLSKGGETFSQLLSMVGYAREESARLVLVVTWTHYLRARWICWRENIPAEFIVAWGIPLPRDIPTDVVMLVLYPVLDLLGLKNLFVERLNKRRSSGKL